MNCDKNYKKVKMNYNLNNNKKMIKILLLREKRNKYQG